MKPICVKCRRFYRPKKTGIAFIEGMPMGNNVQPGTLEPERWKPYKLWVGDLWECQGCGHQLISGTGRSPVAIHHESEFEQRLKNFNPEIQVNDC